MHHGDISITVIYACQSPWCITIFAMARTDPQFNLRLPILLKEQLETAAADSGRSVTAEIIQRLEDSFPSVESTLLENRKAEGYRLLVEIARTRERLSQLHARAVTISGDRDPTISVQIRQLEDQLEVFQVLEVETRAAIASIEDRMSKSYRINRSA